MKWDHLSRILFNTFICLQRIERIASSFFRIRFICNLQICCKLSSLLFFNKKKEIVAIDPWIGLS